MAMYDKVVINSVDVTDYRLDWLEIEEWQQAIDGCTITLSPSVSDVISITVGMVVEITRGMITSTDENVFTGQITQYAPQIDKVVLTCKGPLYDAIKNSDVKSWDKDIDTEAGIGSEIFKTLCDNSTLSYTPAKGVYTNGSIVCTGTNSTDLLIKFIQNDEDDFQKMMDLAEYYNYMISYDYSSGLVNFKPKGYFEYPTSLTVGVDIQNQIKWKENMEQMVNSLKIIGATVYDKRIYTNAGPASSFTLPYTPEDTEVRINSTTTNDLQRRGQKNIGTIGTDFDYYIDVEQKKVVFSGNVSNIWINYGAQVPLPVTLKNDTSIATYGGPRGIPHFKKFTFNDIKDVNDATDRGIAILAKYSVPFIEAKEIQINDETIQTYGNIKPGYLITIIDPFQSRTDTVFVKTVIKSYPHTGDKIEVGDEIWRTEDWQANQMKKINQLFNELNKNQDILISVEQIDNSFTISRYSSTQTRYKICDSFISDHYINGLIGMGEIVNEFETGTAATFDDTGDCTISDSVAQVIVGSGSLKCISSTGSALYFKDSVWGPKDYSSYSGVSSGNASQGCLGVWVYVNATDAAKISSIIVNLKSGPTSAESKDFSMLAYKSVDAYTNWANLTFSLQEGWNYLICPLTKGTAGNLDWTNINSYQFYITHTAGSAVTMYFDYMTISKSNYIGLNGLGYRTMTVV